MPKMENQFRCVLMGEQSLAIQCGEILQRDGHAIVAVVTDDPGIVQWARTHDVRVLPASANLVQELAGDQNTAALRTAVHRLDAGSRTERSSLPGATADPDHAEPHPHRWLLSWGLVVLGMVLGFLAAIGMGTAVTPVGWVIAAGVVTGGAWVGITRYLKKASASRVTVIPKFINTPLDVLALGLFDLLAPLALKVIAVDGNIVDAKRKLIHDYFVREWGYDSDFTAEGIRYTESRISEFSIKSLAQTLAEFTRENRDCNFQMMSQEILGFLSSIVAADGKLDRRQEIEIEKIKAIFKSASKSSLSKTVRAGWGSIRQIAGRLLSRKKSAKDN